MTRGLLILICVVLAPASANSQDAISPPPSYAHEKSPDDAAKAAIFEGDSWRRLMRSFQEWLSVQKVYTDAEITAMKTELEARVAELSATELKDFVSDMQERLNILLSDEATDARTYLGFYSEKARRQRIAPSGQVPDVFHMTVSQLRQELHQFQQQRQREAEAYGVFRQAQSQRTAGIIAQQQARQAQQQRSLAQSRAEFTTNAQLQPQQPRQKPFQNVRSPYSPLPSPVVTGESFGRFEVMRGIYGF